jgi:glutamine amidotransferase
MISVIDYGLGNVNAIVSAYFQLGIKCRIASQPSDLISSTHIILPGVGAYDHALQKIRNKGFEAPLNELVLGEKVKVLGICIGLQIMANNSDEGSHSGFGWINLDTKKIITNSKIKKNLKIPHMGWNIVKPLKKCPLLNGIENDRFYFLHSFALDDPNRIYQSSITDYGKPLVASISYKNIYGTQFHPEKSHHQGLTILKNFYQL